MRKKRETELPAVCTGARGTPSLSVCLTQNRKGGPTSSVPSENRSELHHTLHYELYYFRFVRVLHHIRYIPLVVGRSETSSRALLRPAAEMSEQGSSALGGVYTRVPLARRTRRAALPPAGRVYHMNLQSSSPPAIYIHLYPRTQSILIIRVLHCHTLHPSQSLDGGLPAE